MGESALLAKRGSGGLVVVFEVRQSCLSWIDFIGRALEPVEALFACLNLQKDDCSFNKVGAELRGL